MSICINSVRYLIVATFVEKFLEEPILQIPDLTKEFIVETDASKWAT
jgi:hypothetical protein